MSRVKWMESAPRPVAVRLMLMRKKSKPAAPLADEAESEVAQPCVLSWARIDPGPSWPM